MALKMNMEQALSGILTEIKTEKSNTPSTKRWDIDCNWLLVNAEKIICHLYSLIFILLFLPAMCMYSIYIIPLTRSRSHLKISITAINPIWLILAGTFNVIGAR